MTEQTPSQHDEHPQDDKEDNSPTVHTYGLKDGESITFPVHQKKSSWPAVPIGRLSTISQMVGIFVYYKNMEITDSFQINLTSKEYDILQEMFTKVADLDLVEWSDEFSDLWDKVNDANHEIHFTKWA